MSLCVNQALGTYDPLKSCTMHIHCFCVFFQKYLLQKLSHFLVYAVHLRKMSRVKVKFVLTSQPWPYHIGVFRLEALVIRDLTQTTTAAATRTSPNKRFNEQNNGCARVL